MLETLATGLVAAIGLYLAIGLAFALWFLWSGVDRVDASARRGTPGFRLLILPGSVALWPLLLRRLKAGGPPRERNAHRDLAANATAASPADRQAAGKGR
jgi:hypothetical protein